MVDPATGERGVRLEDVLEVYTRPYDPSRPQVCMDETSKQMLRDARAALSMAPGRTRREDYEYERGGQRVHVLVAAFGQALGGHNRAPHENTHSPASLYEAFDPEKARRLSEKLKIHCTPQARLVAQHGGDRVERPKPPMPREASAGLRDARSGVSGLAGATLRASRSTGARKRRMHASSSSDYILHYRSNGVLAQTG